MPNIDFLSEKDINFLSEMANELKTQDTLATAKPVFWQVEETKRVYGYDPDYADDITFLLGELYGPIAAETIEETKEILLDTFECAENEVGLISDKYDLEEFCEKHKIDLTITGYKDQEFYHGAFLTRSAIEKHLELNRHNYGSKIIRYCQHAFRNPQLERLLKIIEKFADYTVTDGKKNSPKRA